MFFPSGLLRVDEIFETVQGESSSTGFPSVFIRLYGCNVRCLYCDTMPQVGYVDMQDFEIFSEVCKFNAQHICITGGEPMLQAKEVVALANMLVENGEYNVSIETNGIAPLVDEYKRRWRYVMDVKLPSSGEFKRAKEMLLENTRILCEEDEVKFVIQNEEDWDKFIWCLKEMPKSSKAFQLSLFAEKGQDPFYWWKYSYEAPRVLVSPVFDFPPTPEQIAWGAELANRILKMGLYFVRLQVQIHKILGLK